MTPNLFLVWWVQVQAFVDKINCLAKAIAQNTVFLIVPFKCDGHDGYKAWRAAVASWSTRSLYSLSAWPLTHFQVTP